MKTKPEIHMLAEAGNLTEAENLTRQLLQDSPADVQGWGMLGRYCARQGKFQEAVAAFQHMLELDPDGEDANWFLGLLYEREKEWDKARGYFQKVLRSSNYGCNASYRIGMIHTNQSSELYDVKQAKIHFVNATTGEKPLEDAFVQLSKIETGRRKQYALERGLNTFPLSAYIYEEFAEYHLLFSRDYDECIRTVKEAEGKQIESNALTFVMALAYFHKGLYLKADEALQRLRETDFESHESLALSAICLMETEDFSGAERVLSQVVLEDFEDRLNYAAHFLMIVNYLRDDNVQAAEAVVREIPEEGEFYEPLLLFPIGAVTVQPYVVEALDGIIRRSEIAEVIAKGYGIRSLFSYYASEGTDWAQLCEDLPHALEHYPNTTTYRLALGYALSHVGKHDEAIQQMVTAQVHSNDDLYLGFTEFRSTLEQAFDRKGGVNKVLTDVQNILAEDNPYGFPAKNRFARYLLEHFVKLLMARADYQNIDRICEWFTYQQLAEADVLFELAYAYNELGKTGRSKRFYEAYLRDKGRNSAVCNNLGLIYKSDGNLVAAAALFTEALELDPGNEKATRNLQSVETQIEELNKKRRILERAARLFTQETLIVRRAIAQLYASRMEDGTILCNPSEFAAQLHVRTSDVGSQIEELIEKKYFEEVSDSDLIFDGVILKVNSNLVPFLEKELESAKQETQAEQLVAEMTPDKLETKYEYNQSLIDRLSVLSSRELVTMLERDLREIVFSLVTQSHKSALILCGSVVEAILMDRLLSRSTAAIRSFESLQARAGKRVDSKDLDIKNWSLYTILDVAKEENLISNNLYHWGHGIRGFRNLVHPAVETRREMEVSRENAEVAWSVVKRLLKEIS